MTAVEVHAVVEGPDGAPVVVLAPSLGTTLHLWEPQAARLRDRFRVVRYDHRGHGRSPVPRGPYSIAGLGSDVLRLLDSIGAAKAHFCGVSLGGMTGMWLAAHAADRVQSLTLCCTSARLGPPGYWAARAAAVRAGGTVAVADAVVGGWFTPDWAAGHPDVVRAMRRMLVDTPDDGYAACCAAIEVMDLRAELATIGARTLVVAGAEDPATPPEHGRLIADEIPDARWEVLSPAAHMAGVERAEAVTRLLLEHLTDEGAP